MVVEATSRSTRDRDLDEKVRLYLSSNANEYLILDRHSVTERVIHYSRPNWIPTVYANSFSHQSAGNVDVADLLSPSNPHYPVGRQVGSRWRAEQRRTRAKFRNARLLEQLLDAGIQVNMSSSSASLSPARRRFRRNRDWQPSSLCFNACLYFISQILALAYSLRPQLADTTSASTAAHRQDCRYRHMIPAYDTGNNGWISAIELFCAQQKILRMVLIFTVVS